MVVVQARLCWYIIDTWFDPEHEHREAAYSIPYGEWYLEESE